VVTSANQLAKSGKFGDLRRRLVFLLMALVVYRVGAHIPVPGIDPAQLHELFKSQQGGILSLFNMFSGGALSRFTVFALGIMPYISASIIMQLMTYVIPTLEALKKEGESGRRKITQYTRYGTLGLALFQSLGIALALARPRARAGLRLSHDRGGEPTAGTMFLMWLGSKSPSGAWATASRLSSPASPRGCPTRSAACRAGAHRCNEHRGDSSSWSSAWSPSRWCSRERGQRKICHYAKRCNRSRRPIVAPALKLNMSGAIRRSSPADHPAAGNDRRLVCHRRGLRWLTSRRRVTGQPITCCSTADRLLSASRRSCSRRETVDNLKSGAFIPGIRPGEQTARHIDRILSRLTLAGAIYITAVCLLPEFLVLKYNVPFYFGGTSLLIIVVVTMDFWAQVQSYVMSQQYESLLKKANFKTS
jgi:preprotein translocase subunit SecY